LSNEKVREVFGVALPEGENLAYRSHGRDADKRRIGVYRVAGKEDLIS
jgi:hypothetical protein